MSRKHAQKAAGLVAALSAFCGCGDSKPPQDAPAMGSAWRAGPTMPHKRLEPGVVALGDHIVVAGGFDTSYTEGLHITDVVDVFDTASETWLDPLPPVPVAWTHVQMASTNGSIYLLGGLETTAFKARGEAWVLDPGAADWRALASLPAGEERGASGVVATATHIYLLGGASTTAALATCLDYDIAADAWSMLPALPAPRSHPAAMQMPDGTLLVAAGLPTLDPSSPYPDVYALAPGATAWTKRAGAIAKPRGGCAYSVLDGLLACAGGEADQSALLWFDVYDPAADAWTSLEQMPNRRAGIQGAAIGNQLYVPGGAPALVFNPTDTLYIFTHSP